MTNHVTIEAVAHGNLINDKKINIYTVFMYFLRKKMRTKIYKYGVFFMPENR